MDPGHKYPTGINFYPTEMVDLCGIPPSSQWDPYQISQWDLAGSHWDPNIIPVGSHPHPSGILSQILSGVY